MASLGAHGQFPGNMRRDLLRHFTKTQKVPRPIGVDTKILDHLKREAVSTQAVLNLPAMLEVIWQEYRHHWNDIVGANPRRFWDSLRADDPRLPAMGDLLAVPNWQDVSYPFIIHGDGGTYTNKTSSSILVVSTKSLLADSFDGNIITGFALAKDLRTDGTAEPLWESYINLLNFAYDGIHAPHDHNGEAWLPGSTEADLAGRELCDGEVRIVIFQSTGDLEYLSNELPVRSPRCRCP